jgi:type I restriction enzyme S subunit
MMVFRIDPEHCSAFVMRVLNGRSTYEQALQDVMGSTAPHINISTIKNYLMALPTRQEQESIVEYINEMTIPIDRAADRLKREIELLREYHNRLIADVVTGKLDVREAAARLPSEISLDAVENEIDPIDVTDIAEEEETTT